MAIYRLQFQTQNYDWGSVDAISDLLGIDNPDKATIAELWLGDHHRAPSLIQLPDGAMLLDQFLGENPHHLGEKSRTAFGNHLPFLFKILSAEKPLSLQVHPNRAQAAAGFLREQATDIELTAFNRSYPDDNHKPELLYALTSFRVLCGFRLLSEIEDSLRKLNSELSGRLLSVIASVESDAKLKAIYSILFDLNEEQRQQFIEHCLSLSHSPLWQEIHRLNSFFPGDIGVISPLFLNLIELKPSEALFVPPGTLHTYLEGTGLEVMSCSDNVVRAGLTGKYRNTDELMNIVNWSDNSVVTEKLTPTVASFNERIFDTPVKDFNFSILELSGSSSSYPIDAAEVFLCLKGTVALTDSTSSVELSRGEACFVSACCQQLRVSGDGELARVSSKSGSQ